MASLGKQHKQRILQQQREAAAKQLADKPAAARAKKPAKAKEAVLPALVPSTNPALLHKQRVLVKTGKATWAGDKPATPSAPSSTAPGRANGRAKDDLPVLLAALDDDLSAIGALESIEEKRALKAQLLEKYLPYVEAYITSGARYQNPLLVYAVIWSLDCQQLAQAIALADIAIAQNQPMPEQFRRELSDFVVESIAEWTREQHLAKQSASPVVDDVIARVEAGSWPVANRLINGKLYVYPGEVRHAMGDDAEALALFEKAQAANEQAGRKTRVKELRKKLGLD